MRLRKSEICAIIMTSFFLVLLLGYSLGKSDTTGRYTIETDAFSASAPETQAPTQGAEDAEDAVDKFEAGGELLIDINTAGEDELMKLNGIGEVIAARIVSYREENGHFENIEDITNVPGIGAGIFEKISGNITTG